MIEPRKICIEIECRSEEPPGAFEVFPWVLHALRLNFPECVWSGQGVDLDKERARARETAQERTAAIEQLVLTQGARDFVTRERDHWKRRAEDLQAELVRHRRTAEDVRAGPLEEMARLRRFEAACLELLEAADVLIRPGLLGALDELGDSREGL